MAKNDFIVKVDSIISKLNKKQELLQLLSTNMLTAVQSRFRRRVAPDGKSWQASRNGGETLRDTGALLNSLHTFTTNDTAGVATNLKYAKIHNFGGTIKAKNAKYLTIPIAPMAKGKRAREFPDTFIYTNKEKDAAYIAQTVQTKRKRKGGLSGIRLLYALKKEVTMPKREYMGFNDSLCKRIENIIKDFLGG